jgi:hypothetical protein
MSFVITVYVREGIVMACDSRLTLNTTSKASDGNQVVQAAVGQSDSNQKLFCAHERVGISTYGAADIGGVPVAGFIETFIRELAPDVKVNDVPDRLTDYFKKFEGPPESQFHVAGYDGEAQHVWTVNVGTGAVEQVNPPDTQGATWGGEADTLIRLVQPLAELDDQGSVKGMVPYFQVPWGFFTLQDAIDFARYAVQVTIDTIGFQPRPKTVGGAVDILVIRPEGATWVQRKVLHA